MSKSTVEIDWYTPRRLLNTSSYHHNFPGDRFIPNRSLMNLDRAHVLLTTRNKKEPSPESKFSNAYRQKLNENLTLDSEGKPFRMLVFKGNPKPNQKLIRRIDEIQLSDDNFGLNCVHSTKKSRNIQTTAHATFDAPNLRDDYYQNILDWGKNDTLAVALGQDLYLWNTKNKKVYKLRNSKIHVGDDDYPLSVAWSEDAKTLATGHFRSEVRLWDAETLKLVRTINGHTKRVGALAWKGHTLTSGSMDKTIINHDVRVANSLIHRVKAHNGEVCGMKWSARGNLLASGGNDNRVYIWDVNKLSSGKYLHRFKDHIGSVKALAWSPYDTDILASGGGTADGTIKMWNVQKGLCVNSVETKSQVCGLEWNTHHKEILSAHGFGLNTDINTLKNKMCLWKYPSMSRVAELSGHDSRVLHLSKSPDGLTAVSAGADEKFRMWKVFGPSSSVSSGFSELGGVSSRGGRSIIR